MVLVLTAPQIASVAAAAGFSGEALVTAVATAIGESGGRVDAMGDTSITSAKWGPSVGLWQIRSLNAEKGRGTQRDQLANLDPLTNARNAFAISGNGRNFSPWSVYTSGKYRSHLNAARAAVRDAPPWSSIAGKGLGAGVSGTGSVGANGSGTVSAQTDGGLLAPITGIASALGTMASGTVAIGELANKLMWLALPSSVVRIFTGGFGIAFLFIGIYLLGKEVRS